MPIQCVLTSIDNDTARVRRNKEFELKSLAYAIVTLNSMILASAVYSKYKPNEY